MQGLTKEELKVLDEIAEGLMGCTYEVLLEEDPEEADHIYCYAEDNDLI